MALIKCMFCGEEISDKALICPHCGKDLAEEKIQKESVFVCEECGTEIPEGAKSCPRCGWPVPSKEEINNDVPQKVEVTNINMPKLSENKKSRITKIVIAALSAILILCIGLAVSRKNNAEKYISNIESAANSMLSGAAKTETECNLIKKVWYNTIYEKSDTETNKYTRKNGNGKFYDDFNDALSNLFSDASFKTAISSIKTNQESVARTMKSLTNPPEQYADAYDALKDLYEVYLDMTNMAVNPTGSLQTFSSKFNDADSSFMTYYNKVKLYFE